MIVYNNEGFRLHTAQDFCRSYNLTEQELDTLVSAGLVDAPLEVHLKLWRATSILVYKNYHPLMIQNCLRNLQGKQQKESE